MKKILTFLLFTAIHFGMLNGQIVITEINYNCVGYDDFEFVEFYNNSGADIQMENYYIGDGFVFTFPNYNFEADSYMVICVDAPTLLEEFGVVGLQWTDGTTSNSGEDISLYSPDSILIDYVDYEDDTNGWSLLADARGVSLELCDINSDNEDPANWTVSSTPTNAGRGNTLVFATPGAPSDCSPGPIVGCSIYQQDLFEREENDTTFMFFYLTNPNGMPTTLDISVDPSSTVSPDEYEILATTLDYNGMADSVIIIGVVSNQNDEVAEDNEILVLNVTGTNNVERILTEKIYIRFYDDDHTSSESLLIAGVYSADIGGTTGEFGVELFALKDIPDLSIFGVGTANNGGGTDGIEIPLPAVSLSAGDFFFVSDSETRFSSFFGIETGHYHPSIWVTGNDALELFEYGVVIDTYGQIDVDGELSPWDFEDGWAVRLPLTTAGGSTFNDAEWVYSGVGMLIANTNIEAAQPYPLNQYIPPMGSAVDDIDLSNLNIRLSPNPIKDVLYLSFDLNADIEVQDIAVYDLLGKIYARKEIPKGQSQTQINLSDLASGTYLAAVKTSKGVVTKKFLK